MPDVYLGVGSNHQADVNLRQGVRLLRGRVTVVRVSSVYESAAQDAAAPAYLNAAIAVQTALSAAELKAALVEIEDACGRVRRDAQGSKSRIVALDFDILLYGDAALTYHHAGRAYALPHDDILRYAHAAIPLAEIAPNVLHPTRGETIAQLALQWGGAALERRNDLAGL